MKTSLRRACALQGAKISVFIIKNVSKQQIKSVDVCFPGLCLYGGLSLASAVGGWQRHCSVTTNHCRAQLGSAAQLCSVAVEELPAKGTEVSTSIDTEELMQ